MKRSLILFTAALICAVSCGTAGEYAEAGRFQDGIYYKPDPKGIEREPATEDDFRSRASIHNYARQTDSVTIAVDDLDDCYWGWRPYTWYPYHWGYYSHWGYPYYHWGYYQHFGYSYWGYPYYWDYYGWYDPWYWDYGYYGYPYHHYYHGGYYSLHDGGLYTRRTGSATAGVYSHPSVSGISGTPGTVRSVSRVTGSRTASAAARRDLERLNATRATPRTTAVNREPASSEIQNYRRAGATRAGSSASSNSYNGSRDSGSYRYESRSSSSRSSSSSSGWSGGGSSRSSGSSHAGGGSHSSGGSYHGGGGRR